MSSKTGQKGAQPSKTKPNTVSKIRTRKNAVEKKSNGRQKIDQEYKIENFKVNF